MIVFPTLHLHGDHADPVEEAVRWADEGAEWLHVVGSIGRVNNVQSIVEALQQRGVRVQYEGGFAVLEDVATALAWGVARVVLESEQTWVREALQRFGPNSIVVAIHARDGMVATRGEVREVRALDVAQAMKGLGVVRVVYGDGTRAGVNLARTGELAQKSGLKVIASGEVASLDELRQVRWLEPYGVEGVMVGRALVEGRFTLRDALKLVGA